MYYSQYKVFIYFISLQWKKRHFSICEKMWEISNCEIFIFFALHLRTNCNNNNDLTLWLKIETNIIGIVIVIVNPYLVFLTENSWHFLEVEHKQSFIIAIKLDHFTVKKIFFLCYKHSSLTTRIGKQVKTKFVGMDSWFDFFQSFILQFLISLN